MSKERWLKDAKSHLQQAKDILGDDSALTLSELKAAAMQAQQAASELWKLAGLAYETNGLKFGPPEVKPESGEPRPY